MSTNDTGTSQNKVQELIGLVKKKLHLGKKKKEDELFDDEDEQLSKEEAEELDPEKPIGGTSMLDGDHGKIFGVSRPVVVGIGIFIFVVFSLALIFATDNGDNQATKAPPQQKESDINKSSNRNNLPDDYATLAQAEQKKNGAKGQNGQPGSQKPGENGNVQAQKIPSAQQSVSQPSTSTVVPRVTSVAAPPAYSQPYQIPSSVSAAPAAVSAPAAPSSSSGESSNSEESVADRLKDRLTSAISFAIGSSGSNDSSGGSSTSGGSDSSSSPSATTSVATNNTYSGASENTLTAGTVIPAMLLTGINTDVPGQVKAQIMADVYDYSGTNLILPAGSQVLGSYTGGASNGNNRIQVTFNTIVLPDGGTWNIGNSISAIDGAGYMGIAGKVHHHTGANFAKGLMNSALTALGTLGVDNVTVDLGAYQNLTNATSNITITVDPGYQFNLYVSNNVTF